MDIKQQVVGRRSLLGLCVAFVIAFSSVAIAEDGMDVAGGETILETETAVEHCGNAPSCPTVGGQCSLGQGSETTGDAPQTEPVGDLLFQGGSIIDNLTLNHINIANDYDAGKSGSGSSGSCGGCGDSVPNPGALEPLRIERRHRLREQSFLGSFGPGVFHNHDQHLSLYQAGDGLHMDNFDPRVVAARRYVDGRDGDEADGVFKDMTSRSIKEAFLMDGQIDDQGRASGSPTSDLYKGKSITVVSHYGDRSHYEIVNTSPGQPYVSTGHDGDGLQFDGVDDIVQIGSPEAMAISGEITISAWVKPDTSVGTRSIVGHGVPSRASDSAVFFRIQLGRYFVGSWDGENRHQASARVREGDVGSWVHLTGLYNGTEWKLYRNGIHVATKVDSVGALDTPDPWAIGSVGTGGVYFDGNIDEVRVYNRGLSREEVADLFSGAQVTDGLVSYYPMDNGSPADVAGGNDGVLGTLDAGRRARVTRMEDRRGYGTRYTYQAPTPEEVSVSPDRQLQLGTVTDASGRSASFSYHPEQQSGGWVVDQITLPNGEPIDYGYVDGRLATVDHPDGTQTTITVTSNAETQTTNITYDDPAAEGTHRRKTAYLSNNIVIANDRNELFNNSAMLLRMLVNGDGEVGYLNIRSPNDTWTGVRAIYEGGGRIRRLAGSTRNQYYTEGWSLGIGGDGDIALNGSLESMWEQAFLPDDRDERFREQSTGAFSHTRSVDGSTLRYEYDSADPYPAKKMFTDGTSESFAYNSFRQITRYRDRLDRVTKTTYDAMGNRTSIQTGLLAGAAEDGSQDIAQPELATQTWTYYPAGDPHQYLLQYHTDAVGNRVEYLYNDDHLLESVMEPDDDGAGFHVAASYTYDAAKRLKTQSDALGRTRTYDYDPRDRVIRVTYADSSTEETVYGQPGSGSENLVALTKDRNGVVTSTQYDNTGRMTARTVAIDNVGADGSILAGYTPPAQGSADSLVTTYEYLDGANKIASMTTQGRTTTYQYDYRMRRVATIVQPRQGQSLTSRNVYKNNLLFEQIDPYGRSKYFGYRSSDRRLIRTVEAIIPSPPSAPVDNGEVVNLPRVETFSAPVANSPYLVRDVVLDVEGQTIANIDPRGIVDVFVYDSRGRRTLSVKSATTLPPYNRRRPGDFDPTDDAQLDPLAQKTQTIYDAASNVVETRSPRYFDVADTDGFQKASTAMTYTRRNLPATTTVAAGADDYVAGEALSVRATKSVIYNLDKTVATSTDFRGNVTENLWSPCCSGRLLSTIDPTQLASNRQYDFYGNVTAVDQSKAGTESFTTTRYDDRHRPIARTQWLVEPDAVDPNNVPIAGLDGVDAADGLTTRMLYDESLTDNVGLESGVSLDRLDGDGTFTVSISGLLGKLADAGITPVIGADFSARVTINPEGEISASVSDGTGRAVISGIITGDATGTPITWNITQHDATEDVAGFGVCLVTTRLNAVGDVTQSFTDGAGRVIQSVDGAGMISTRQYDANGNTLVSRDANGVGQDCVFDVHDRDVQCTDTAGDVTSRTYDRGNNVVSKTDAKGKIETCSFDPLGRQYRCTDRIGGITGMRYDQDNHLLTLTDAEGQVTAYTYDSVGNKLTETYPDHVAGSSIGDASYGIITHSYDALHRTSVTTDQQGDTRTMAYDLAGRLLSKTYVGHASGPLAGTSDVDSFTYDDASRMLTATSQRYDNVCEMTYDDAGRKETESLTIGGQTYTCTTDYDDASRVATTTYPDGTEVSRTYTNRSQLETVARDGVTIDTRTYDDGGRMASSVYNNGVSETRTYNADNTLSDIAFAGRGGDAIGDLAYTWDENKNKTSESIDGVMSDFGFGSTSYDAEDRLTSWDRADNALNQSWNLSLVGDWDSVTENGSVQNRTHGQAHELLTAAGQAVQHDAKGNQTLIPALLTRSGTANLSLSWDFDNKLLGADTDEDGSIDVAYLFDATGRRVGRTAGNTTTVYVQNGQQTIADYRLGRGANNPTSSYVFASYIDEPIMRTGQGGLAYYHRNQQYSVIALTGGNGKVSNRFSYDAYGNLNYTNSNGKSVAFASVKNRFTYTGREWDDELGLYHYRARIYDPVAGRFCSRDPIGYVDGANLYRSYFVIDGLDPSGEATRSTEMTFQVPVGGTGNLVSQVTPFAGRDCGGWDWVTSWKLPAGFGSNGTSGNQGGYVLQHVRRQVTVYDCTHQTDGPTNIEYWEAFAIPPNTSTSTFNDTYAANRNLPCTYGFDFIVGFYGYVAGPMPAYFIQNNVGDCRFAGGAHCTPTDPAAFGEAPVQQLTGEHTISTRWSCCDFDFPL